MTILTILTIEKTVKDTLTSNGAPRMAAKDQIGDGGILKNMQMLKETLHWCVLNVDVVEVSIIVVLHECICKKQTEPTFQQVAHAAGYPMFLTILDL